MDASLAIIITAAGRGTRAGGDLPKQWQEVGGQPVLSRTIRAFDGLGRIILTVHPDDMGRALALTRGRVVLVAGGETRAQSVLNALETLESSGVTRVLIHDGARPFASSALIRRVLAALDTQRGCRPGAGRHRRALAGRCGPRDRHRPA